MEHGVRPVAREHFPHPLLVLRVADRRDHLERRPAVAEFLLDRVERELGELEEHQARRVEARDLAAELGADRAAGAGDEDGPAADEGLEARFVERHRVAAEQVVELDRAQRRDAHLARDDVAQRRHGHHRDAGRGAQLDRALPLAVRSLRHGDDRLLDAVALRRVGHARHRAEHLHAGEGGAALGRVVVEHAHDAPLRAGGEVLQQRRRRGAGADHEHRHRLRMRDDRQQPAFAPGAVGEAVAAHRQREQQRRDEKHRARHLRLQAREREQRRHRERAATHRDQQPLQVGQARVAPQAAIQAEEPEHRRVHGHDRHEQAEHHLHVVFRDLEVEAQPEGRHPGDAGGEHVVAEDDEAADVHEAAVPRRWRAQRTSTQTASPASSAVMPKKTAACSAGGSLRPKSAASAQSSIAA